MGKQAVIGNSMRAVLLALAILPAAAFATEPFLADLERRLKADGVEGVNAHLSARPLAMAELNQSAADCNPQAIDLAAKLGRGLNSNATKLHNESLRIATGACAEFVLSRLSLQEVPKICSSVSSWTVTQMARELRRRMKEIEDDERLRTSERGRACGAAYLFELQNTRVGIRTAPPYLKSK
ncbi:MAG: hypothetical protein ABIR26_19790 [Ramlibacter sp.]